MPKLRALIVTALVAGAVLAIPTLTVAKDGEVIHRGDCSGAANWKLKVAPDDGRLQVEFEVDSNRNGQTWRVKIRDNGVLRSNELRTTRGPSGSFSVERRIANMAGTDAIVARARNVNNGQLCVARLSF